MNASTTTINVDAVCCEFCDYLGLTDDEDVMWVHFPKFFDFISECYPQWTGYELLLWDDMYKEG